MLLLGKRPDADSRPCPERARAGLPLSPNEERYVLTEAMASEMVGNPLVVRIRGAFDPDRFTAALQDACDRHENRRCGFEPSADGRFTRYVEATASLTVQRRAMPGASQDAVRDAIEAWFYQKAGFTPATLHRYLLIQVAEDDHVFAYFLHHATTDATTTRAFIAEVFDRYAGAELGPAPVPYSEVWDWDWAASDAYRTAEAFWTERLGGAQDIAGLPEDRAGRAQAVAARPVRLRLGQDVVGTIKDAAARIGVSDFTYVYAACLVLLTRLTGRAQVFTTFQSAGRRNIPNAEGAHGVFSNGLILATPVDETESVAVLAGRLKGEIRAALEHEIFPYHHAIRRTGVAPHFGINWFPALETFDCPGLEITRPDMSYGRYDHDLNVRFIREDDTGTIDLIVFYRAEAFSRTRVEAIAGQIEMLLVALAADVEEPIATVRSADLAPEGLLPDPAAPLPEGGDELIHSRFLDRARETPDAVAIVGPGASHTYAEVEQRSRDLALRLRAQGVGPGDRVAILAERRAELIWSLLAVTRLGSVFAVLDSDHPPARLAALAAICAPRLIITTGGPDLAATARRLADAQGCAVFDPIAPASQDTAGLDAADPAAPAYILFTSGSTGQPKGVAVSHQPLAHFVDWQARTFGLTAADRVTLLSGLAHDPLLRDVFTPLSVGAAVLIPDPAIVAAPGELALWFRKTRATLTHLSPAMGQVLAAGASKARELPDLRLAFWGGDLLRPARIEELARLAPKARHINIYGATETPQAAGVFEWDGDLTWKTMPVGKGAEGFQLLVVDADKRPVGLGEAGEIAVRSNWLSLGYVRDGKVVAPDDRGLDGLGRRSIYYTGDRGLILPDGSVMALGRLDDQVKVRGYRVDLSEVTAALLGCAGVRQAVVLPDGEGEALRLAAFVVAGPQATEAELRTGLIQRLPGYMVPHTIRRLDRLPLLPNGKTDRAALLALLDAPPPPPPAAKPAGRATDTERALIEAWSSILATGGVTPDASFASLGGDSLSYVQAYLATEEVIGEAPVGWHLMSISELAGAKQTRNSAWSVIDSPLLVRALGICLVVAGHFHLTHTGLAGGGATRALLVVSGYMLGSLTLQQAFKTGSAQPVLRAFWSIFVPTAAFSALIFLARLPGDQPPASYIYLFNADFTDFAPLVRAGQDGDNYLWYVHCLLHMMLILYLALLGLKAAGRFGIGRRAFLLGLFALSCLGRFALPAVWDPRFFGGFYDGFVVANYLPTTHLPTLLLGALIATAVSWRDKLLLAPLIVVYALASAYFYGSGPGLYFLLGSLLVVALPRVSVPRAIAPAVFALAGASLWIYLSHMLLRDGLGKFGLDGSPPANVVVALAVGVGLWSGWSVVLGYANRRAKGSLALQSDAAV